MADPFIGENMIDMRERCVCVPRVFERERFIMCVRAGKGKIYAVMFGKTKRKLERRERERGKGTIMPLCLENGNESERERERERLYRYVLKK